ncbi:2-keto-4-pentenoate hydratase/2-oxohepta-3-ene-1,7-dioic acid hydratase (catechol pathway) [Mesobacillus persicus]|uniref:2-keto-4-pentenoate hydratase/2-oxohepta-3-ene-1,7-dioic acid hydratase (Catechol pathway) n=1 Tax=Mesobacillus persicus TaxID=930146 RepID=A0A1H7WMB5_9BACI|nr:fumarylacetoacetate hydrolase family protein [Mesobacillus persicus]SEM22219.1 2-keto-4-pentenoate hydratase/2-oxohepta-3-ene-1,7-dioic acid hydratase (catechol pathway) [Mesobacillus persicus]
MNIFCVGRNYANHAKELGNALPQQPVLFSKPSRAFVETNGQAISVPQHLGQVHYEIEVVLKIDREVKQGESVWDVVSQIALGLDLTLREVQKELQTKGHPWLRAKGFKHSAIVTPFWDIREQEAYNTEFSLLKNGNLAQKGQIKDMIFNLQTIIDECENCFGLGEGDIIFTGTPEGVGPLHSGDLYQLYWGKEEKGRFTVE